MFNFNTPEDMLDKLERDLQKCRDAHSEQDVVDSAVAFSSTAWHMHEWVWSHIVRENPSLKVEISRELGNVTPQKVKKEHLAKYCIKKIPALEYCQKIVTTVKHTECDTHKDDGFDTAETSVQAFPDTKIEEVQNAQISSAQNIVIGSSRYVAKIILQDDTRLRAIPEFEKVYEFWRDFINR